MAMTAREIRNLMFELAWETEIEPNIVDAVQEGKKCLPISEEKLKDLPEGILAYAISELDILYRGDPNNPNGVIIYW